MKTSLRFNCYVLVTSFVTLSAFCQPCLVVQCPTNKTVACGTPWTFDSPTASTCCAVGIVTSTGVVTNVLVTSNGPITNGACPLQTITESWSIMDGCGNSNSCSQTVTVTGCCTTNCLQVLCPADKTVPCGTAWSFDSPVASTCCTNQIPTSTGLLTNVLVTSNGTVTNGVCPKVSITQTWTIADGCGNSTNCSQTVTVTGCCVTNCLQVQCPTNKTVPCGTPWTFDPPLVTTCCPTNVPGTLTNVLIIPAGLITNGACPQETVTESWTITDGCGNTTNCSQTVTILGCCNCLQIQCATNKTVQCGTAWSFDPPLVTTCCRTNVSGTLTNVLIIPAGLITNGACPQETVTESWTITDGCGNTTNCSQTVTILGCCNCLQIQCATNKTVQCGTAWSFDPPLVTTCCRTNVPGTLTNILIVPAGLITNGACPQETVTESWTITDGCGNTTNCSQTVTILGCCNCLQIQCATNKSVQCGTAWTFDPPLATTCCTNRVPGTLTNLLITSSSTVTNGVCPKLATRTWLIVDGCGDTNTCSQQVTLVDTTPPTIVCPTNTVVVALNSNCMLVIPAISVTATDNCTPVCSLIYHQSPPAGTILPGPGANVTITVTDLCGNSNSCVVAVLGLPRTPPVVTCPAVMTVTDCLVPCVPVTASDNCCPTSSLVITQSPPCGTLVGPGLTTVTVTVTDCHGNRTVKIVHLVITSPSQSFLAALTNTGVGPGGVLLTDGMVDPYYALPASAVPAGMPTDYTGNSVAVSDICHLTMAGCAWNNTYVSHPCYEYVPWSLPPDAAYVAALSKWIGPNYTSNGCDPSGLYTYTLNFVLPGAANPATATISGRWAADDTASMKLNGAPVVGLAPGLSSWTPFTIPAGSPFVVGANSLKFIVNNSTIWTGLRVEFTNASYACATCAPPWIIWMTPAQSLQVGSTATFNVTANGSWPFTYQWLHNNVPIPNATNSQLQIPSIGYGNAGLYTVVISNPCGVITRNVQLTVTSPWWWQWGWWNMSSVARPLAATVGPDLNLTGPSFASTYGINAGSTEDFGLPAPGGQIVNVIAPNPESGGSIEIPPIAPTGTTSNSSYTVVMDYYQPDTSLGTPSTLFQSGGQDGIALTLDETNYLHISGSADGVPFDAASAQPMAVNEWTRLALVVDNPPDAGTATLKAIGNGQIIIIIHPCICCISPFNPSTINWTLRAPTLFSAPTTALGPNGVFFISSLQFHDIALPDDMLAGIGSPESGPAPGNQTSAATAPVISATMVDGTVNLTWSGSAYALQETADLSSGVWEDSELPFTESTDTSGGVATTAAARPSPSAPAKFYRLVFRP